MSASSLFFTIGVFEKVVVAQKGRTQEVDLVSLAGSSWKDDLEIISIGATLSSNTTGHFSNHSVSWCALLCDWEFVIRGAGAFEFATIVLLMIRALDDEGRAHAEKGNDRTTNCCFIFVKSQHLLLTAASSSLTTEGTFEGGNRGSIRGLDSHG